MMSRGDVPELDMLLRTGKIRITTCNNFLEKESRAKRSRFGNGTTITAGAAQERVRSSRMFNVYVYDDMVGNGMISTFGDWIA